MRRTLVGSLVLALTSAAVPAGAAPPDKSPPAAAAPVDAVADEARRHAEAGDALYDQGRYEEAIVEYQAYYKLKPHPNALYNIAQAEERLLDYAQAVHWFQRYLDEAPPDAKNRRAVEARLRVLANLPARISVSTIPARVRVTLKPATGGGPVVEQDAPALFKVPAGAYDVTLALQGYETQHHRLEAAIGQPYFYQFSLTRSTAPLTIFSRPRGARVFIDDKLVGETPFADQVEVGRHRLLLEHPDYPWFQRTVEVKPGAAERLEVKLARPVRSGRTELVIGSMVYGGVAGPLLVAAVSSKSDFLSTDLGVATLVLSSAAGLGAGFLGSFLTTRDGIKVGHSSLLIGGGAFGTGWGASLALGLKLDTPYVYGLALLGGAIGITATALITRFHDVMPGTSAIVNSGALWGTAAGALFAQAIFQHPTAEQMGWFTFGGVSIGLLTGSLIAWKLDRSRGHVFLVDVGGFVGTGLGFALGAAVGASSNGDIVQDGARYALGGAALGILAAATLSKNYKGDLPPVEALLFRDDKKSGRRWSVGLPKLSVEPALLPEGRTMRIIATVADGTW